MRERLKRLRQYLAGGVWLAAALGAGMAAAQSDDKLKQDCSFGAPAVAVPACNALLAPGKLPSGDRAWHYKLRGDAYLKQGDTARALADYSRAFEVDPKEGQYPYARARVYRDMGDLDRAIAEYTMAIALRGDQSGYYYDRGMVYQTQRKFERAIADYDQALRLKPRDFTVWMTRGSANLKLGKFADAIVDFDAALKLLDGKSAPALYSRGYARQKTGDSAGGSADMAAATKLMPTIASAFEAWLKD